MGRHALILGAGIVGIACAAALQRDGWQVTLVDRHDPAQGASFGNAGIIQAEAVAPYAMPRNPATLLTMLRARSPGFDYSWRGLLENAPALWAYWRNSAKDSHATIGKAYAPLVRAAKAAHEALIEESGAAGCIGGQGLSELFRDARALRERIREAEAIRAASGVDFEVWEGTPPPALSGIIGAHAGGLTWTESLCCTDPHGLAMNYLDLVRARQGRFLRGDARGLRATENGWSLPTQTGDVAADVAVICLGAAVNDLAAVSGVKIPLVPKRGYHRHYAPDPARPLAMPVLDADHGYVLAPMKAGLRLTTGAQLRSQGAKPDPAQVAQAEEIARSMFAMGPAETAEPWTGVRPCTADMLPVIGKAPDRPNLWFATGHGHQGLTLSAITGRLLADAMAGRPPSVDITPFAPSRFAA